MTGKFPEWRGSLMHSICGLTNAVHFSDNEDVSGEFDRQVCQARPQRGRNSEIMSRCRIHRCSVLEKNFHEKSNEVGLKTYPKFNKPIPRCRDNFGLQTMSVTRRIIV